MSDTLTPEYTDWLTKIQPLVIKYHAGCRDAYSYELWGQKLMHYSKKYGISVEHLNRRGKYDQYPTGTVTHQRDTELFVCCAQCRRNYCTDAWDPISYSSVFDRVRYAATHKAYYCLAGDCAAVAKTLPELKPDDPLLKKLYSY